VRHPPAKPRDDLPLDTSLLKPGMRLGVAVSGGADSVALLRALASRSTELGLVLHVAHLHHGLRGEEADGDREFCRDLAAKLNLPFHEARVDTAAAAEPDPKSNKPRETIEEAARRLRYAWFRLLMSSGEINAIATAHTLDDQAETVLAKFLRGAWTEGLSGIHPKLESPEGRGAWTEGQAGISPKLKTAGAGGSIVRPLLGVTRAEIEAYLRALGQDWREDSSNRHLSFTRNRIRHELLPVLESWNPRLREHLAQMAKLARDEEAWWQAELERLAPQLLLPGRPVRGGGRAAGSGLAAGLAIDAARLSELAPALQRRLLRHAAGQFGASLDFPATETLRSLALHGRAGQKLAVQDGLCAERTARELRLSRSQEPAQKGDRAAAAPEYRGRIPGQIEAPAFGVRLHLDIAAAASSDTGCRPSNDQTPQVAVLRTWRPGDRVRLRYSSGPRKIKEVLERLRVTGTDRAIWPVLEIDGRIVWMRGVELEPDQEFVVSAVEMGLPG
jgi:tRNA(Ile)-lysidine synthase